MVESTGVSAIRPQSITGVSKVSCPFTWTARISAGITVTTAAFIFELSLSIRRLSTTIDMSHYSNNQDWKLKNDKLLAQEVTKCFSNCSRSSKFESPSRSLLRLNPSWRRVFPLLPGDDSWLSERPATKIRFTTAALQRCVHSQTGIIGEVGQWFRKKE